jgi:uncharacterized protein
MSSEHAKSLIKHGLPKSARKQKKSPAFCPNFFLGAHSCAGHTSPLLAKHLGQTCAAFRALDAFTIQERTRYGGTVDMNSRIHIRDVNPADLDAILAINNSAGDSILPIDRARMARFLETARYFRVAEINGLVAGFLVALTPEADYDSPNFSWFKKNYADFVYIDRVVMTPDHRRSGIGRLFYADILSFAEVRHPILVTEVFIQPRDDVSLLFFKTQGFTEAGQQTLSNGRRVSLMSKTLEAFPFVRDTYLSRSATGLGLAGSLEHAARP